MTSLLWECQTTCLSSLSSSSRHPLSSSVKFCRSTSSSFFFANSCFSTSCSSCLQTNRFGVMHHSTIWTKLIWEKRRHQKSVCRTNRWTIWLVFSYQGINVKEFLSFVSQSYWIKFMKNSYLNTKILFIKQDLPATRLQSYSLKSSMVAGFVWIVSLATWLAVSQNDWSGLSPGILAQHSTIQLGIKRVVCTQAAVTFEVNNAKISKYFRPFSHLLEKLWFYFKSSEQYW